MYQINVGYQIDVGLGILVKINRGRILNKRRLRNILPSIIEAFGIYTKSIGTLLLIRATHCFPHEVQTKHVICIT